MAVMAVRGGLSRWGQGVLLLACVVSWVFPAVEATHFRFGSMSWTSGTAAQGEQRTLTLTMVLAFRRSFGWNYDGSSGGISVGTEILPNADTAVSWGDGSSQQGSTIVEALSAAEDFWLGTMTMTHAYTSHNNSGAPWRIQFTSCCRISPSSNYRLNHVNNPDMDWFLSIDADLWADGDAGGIQSPDITTLPIVYLPDVGTHSFFLGGFDRGAGAGGAITYSFSQMSHGLGTSRAGVVLDMTLYDPAVGEVAGGEVGSLVAATGEYVVTTTNLVKGLYSTQVVLTSDTTGLQSVVDFFIAVLPQEKVCTSDCAYGGSGLYRSCTLDENACQSCPVACPSEPTGVCREACKGNSPPTIDVPRELNVSIDCTAHLAISSSDMNDEHDVPTELYVLNGVLPAQTMVESEYDGASGTLLVDYWWVPDKVGTQSLCFYASDSIDFGTVECVEVITVANDIYCDPRPMPTDAPTPAPVPTPAPTNPPPSVPSSVSSPWYGGGEGTVSGEGGGGEGSAGSSGSTDDGGRVGVSGGGTPTYGTRTHLYLDNGGHLIVTPGCNVTLVAGLNTSTVVTASVLPAHVPATISVDRITNATLRPPDVVVEVEFLFMGDEDVSVCTLSGDLDQDPLNSCIVVRAGAAEDCCADGSSAFNRTCGPAVVAVGDVLADTADTSGAVIAGAVLGAILALLLLLALLWWLLAGSREDEKHEDAKVVLRKAKSEVAVAPAPPPPPATVAEEEEPKPKKKTKPPPPPLDWDDDLDGLVRPKGGKGAKRVGGGYKYWNPVTGKWQYEPPSLEWTDEMEQRFAAQEERVRKREALKAKEAKKLARQQRKEAAEAAAAGP